MLGERRLKRRRPLGASVAGRVDVLFEVGPEEAAPIEGSTLEDERVGRSELQPDRRKVAEPTAQLEGLEVHEDPGTEGDELGKAVERAFARLVAGQRLGRLGRHRRSVLDLRAGDERRRPGQARERDPLERAVEVDRDRPRQVGPRRVEPLPDLVRPGGADRLELADLPEAGVQDRVGRNQFRERERLGRAGAEKPRGSGEGEQDRAQEDPTAPFHPGILPNPVRLANPFPRT